MNEMINQYDKPKFIVLFNNKSSFAIKDGNNKSTLIELSIV